MGCIRVRPDLVIGLIVDKQSITTHLEHPLLLNDVGNARLKRLLKLQDEEVVGRVAVHPPGKFRSQKVTERA